ncbi:MAG: hypothetical protein Kow00105_10740 [Phycisphaeraceae bacterium]
MTNNNPQDIAYLSPTPFSDDPIPAVAVYCSDGRFGDQFSDFINDHLGLPRHDRVAVPGGPASLLDYDGQESSALSELLFLIEAHGLKRVILIQHDGCAYYKLRLGVADNDLRLLQDDDLSRAAQAIHEHTGLENIEGYFAARTPEGIRFIPVPISLEPEAEPEPHPET